MRKIEFRYIWRRLADGHLYTTITPIECLEGKGDTPFLGNEQWELVARSQFVGVLDTNKTKVFEDDVLKHHGLVAWNGVEHRWSAIDLNWNDKREWHDLDYLTVPFEVIGNRWESPELLGETK